jgi:DNA (cytosine-5)-methyltransferase 1
MKQVEQVNNSGEVVTGFDQVYTRKEINSLFSRMFSEQVVFDQHQAIVSGKIGILSLNVTYLGGNWEPYKKRIQIQPYFRTVYQENEDRHLSTIFAGVYHHDSLNLFVVFKGEPYIRRKCHNSSAHVHTLDLVFGVKRGSYRRIDSNNNEFYVFDEKHFVLYVRSLITGKPIPGFVDKEKQLLSFFGDFYDSMKKDLRGIDCYEEMSAANDNNAWQNHWEGFYTEFLFKKYLDEHPTQLLKWWSKKGKQQVDLDLCFDEGKWFFGDMKTDRVAGEIQGNKQSTILRVVKDNHGRVWYVVIGFTSEMDVDHDGVTTHWWNAHKPPKSSKKPVSPDECLSLMKYSIHINQIEVFDINELTLPYMTQFAVSPCGGKAREPKLKITRTAKDFFRIYEKSDKGSFLKDKPLEFSSELPMKKGFKFIDLFSGIGGFHQAMESFGGQCVLASDIDKECIKVYNKNYGVDSNHNVRDIKDADVPGHDVLCAGFPCQAFSKAGKRRGFEETRGTLFFEVARILRAKHPKYFVLENVRNLVSHDGGNTFRVIKTTLHDLGYRMTASPLILSPYQFGIPQIRDRVYILGFYDPEHVDEPLVIKLPKLLRKQDNSIDTILEKDADPSYKITSHQEEVLQAWDDFYHGINLKVIGFPVWSAYFKKGPSSDMPGWKKDFVLKNNKLYKENQQFIDSWLVKNNYLRSWTPSERKFEWQAGTSESSVWECLIQYRPSGIRVKKPDCFPALVAIVQTPIIGKYKRRITVREAARLQSFPDSFIPDGNKQQAYKQFGNSVNILILKTLFEALRKKY